MKKIGHIILTLLVFISCNIDKPVDKSKLASDDYRLFQGTDAWPLARAAYYGDLKKVEEILKENPELANVQDSICGNTMLMISIIREEYKLFRILLDNGANVNYHNKRDGYSPLIAACHDDVKFVRDLIKKGAEVNNTSPSYPHARCTALMEAAHYGNKEIVKYLIEHGADVNYKNNYGWTALGESLLTDKFEVALILLNNGADYLSPIYNTLDEKGKCTIPVNILSSLRVSTPDPLDSRYGKKRGN